MNGNTPDPHPFPIRDPYERAAHGILWLLHPFFVPLYMMLVLLFTRTVFSHYAVAVKLYLVWVVVLFTLVLPALSLVVLRSLGKLTDYRIDRRRDRYLPLALGAVFYLLCAMTLAKVPSAFLLRRIMVAAAGCEMLCLLVTLRWKISLHLTGMGAVVALFSLLSIAGVGDLMGPLLVAVVGSGLLASSRLYLGCHNGLQILAGFCGGFAIMTLAILFL